MEVIQDGDVVVSMMHDDEHGSSMLKVTSKCEQKIGKTKVNVKQVVGSQFGTVFQVGFVVVFSPIL